MSLSRNKSLTGVTQDQENKEGRKTRGNVEREIHTIGLIHQHWPYSL